MVKPRDPVFWALLALLLAAGGMIVFVAVIAGGLDVGGGERPRSRALSCQRDSSRCDSRVKTRKSAIPVTEISTRAANIRGMLRRKPASTMRKARPAP